METDVVCNKDEREGEKKETSKQQEKQESKQRKKKVRQPVLLLRTQQGLFWWNTPPSRLERDRVLVTNENAKKSQKVLWKTKKKKKRSSLTLPVAYTQVACIYERKRALLHTHEDGKLGPGQVGPDTMTLRFVGNTFPSPFKFLVPSTSFLSFFCVSLVFCLFVRLV